MPWIQKEQGPELGSRAKWVDSGRTKVQGLLDAPPVLGTALGTEKRAWDRAEPLRSGAYIPVGKAAKGTSQFTVASVEQQHVMRRTRHFVQTPEEGPAEEEALRGGVGAWGAAVFPEHGNAPLDVSFLSSVPSPLSNPAQ